MKGDCNLVLEMFVELGNCGNVRFFTFCYIFRQIVEMFVFEFLFKFPRFSELCLPSRVFSNKFIIFVLYFPTERMF